MFGPALPLSERDSLASRFAQFAFDSGYFVFVGRGRSNALSFKKRIELADLLLDLLFLDLITDQRHLQRGRIVFPLASCHAYSPGQEYHMSISMRLLIQRVS